MTGTAFVLSGGAGLGAVQVGGLAALLEAGVQPDLIRQADTLIDCAYVQTRGWLAGGRRFERDHAGMDATVRP